ncbi:MAG: hypothetical protein Q8K78_00875, partial [Planctomycetaceae bacterium]|nr:hypothetical protein [Planctomycetaceae bacterium]
SRRMKLPQIFRRLPFEVGEGIDAIFEVKHRCSNRIEFDANSMLPEMPTFVNAVLHSRIA